MSAGEVRQASDGWHVLLRIDGVEHRLWLRESPVAEQAYAAELPFDEDFEIRAHAARRLWRALNGRPAGIEGNSYRAIAEGLFGATHIPDRAWKTHDLRNRTIRLVQSGFALMRGGYRALLRHARRGR